MTTRGSSQGWLDAKSVLRNQPQDTEHVLSILSIEGRVIGGEMSAQCPIHSDRRPSFNVNLGTGLWICHAGCGAGNLSSLVMLATGMRRARADRWLRGARLEARPDDEDDDDDDWDSPEADWGHLENQYFKLYAEPPDFALKERRISPEAAADLSIRWGSWTAANGLPRRGWAYDPHWGAWALPVRHADTHGLRGWQIKIVGTVEDGNERTKTMYGTRKSRTLFGIDVFTPGSPVILVESPLDVAVLRTANLPALASFGANVSRRQRKLLADRASRIVIAMDNDEAGLQSHDKLVKAPELSGKELFRFSYAHAPDGKDPGGMSDDEIREGLRTAKRIRR